VKFMANEEHLRIIREGFEVWNLWRKQNSHIQPDLSGVHLGSLDLRKANLSHTNLRGSDLSGAIMTALDLRKADLSDANLGRTCLNCSHLGEANLTNANLSGAYFVSANLSKANLCGANLTGACMGSANLSEVNLCGTNLTGANLGDSNLSDATLGATILANIDLRGAVGLDTVKHCGPSSIDLNTLYNSRGQIREKFFLDAGLSEDAIEYLRPVIRSGADVHFGSRLISYSAKDEDFTRHLLSRMTGASKPVWFMPMDRPGMENHCEQLLRRIQSQHTLIPVLSTKSMQSDWLKAEIRSMLKFGKMECRCRLFPIRLVGLDELRSWTCFDADAARDLAVEVREYPIPDFSNWRDGDAFEEAFEQLRKELKTRWKSEVL
jgi:uncharacterized protein YjbI with pentapeptide repeats